VTSLPHGAKVFFFSWNFLFLFLFFNNKVVSDLSKEPFQRGVSMDGYPLRPELLESIYHLYRETRDPSLLKIALRAQQALRKTRVTCGFCSVHGVLQTQHVLLDQVCEYIICSVLINFISIQIVSKRIYYDYYLLIKAKENAIFLLIVFFFFCRWIVSL
jgi:hypothetical protein